MTHRTHNRPAIGKTCRSAAAIVAGSPAAGASRRQRTLFSQFPPTALFAALKRAGLRQSVRRRIASGTRLAR
jgi:hypothetical protein